MGEHLNDRPFCRYWVIGTPIQISVCMCGFSLHSSVYSVVLVWSTLSVQERNAFFIVWTLHSELYMVIHVIYMIEHDVHLGFFSYADYIIYISFPPWCWDGALWTQCQFFKIFHVNICYVRWDWGTYCCSLQMLVKLVLEGEHAVVQNKFQERNNFVFGNVARWLVVLPV